MRQQILVTTSVLLVVAGAATGAHALDRKASRSISKVEGLHAGIRGEHRHRARLAKVRGRESWRQADTGYRGGFIDLGPLGFTAACGAYRSRRGYCGQGYSVSAWTY